MFNGGGGGESRAGTDRSSHGGLFRGLQACEELDDTINNSARTGGATRNVRGNGDNRIDAASHAVAVLKYAAGTGTCAHCDDEFRLSHLLINTKKTIFDLAGDGAGADQHVGVARHAFELDAEALNVVVGHKGGDDFNIAGVARAAIEMENPGRLDPRPGHYFLHQAHGLYVTFDKESSARQ